MENILTSKHEAIVEVLRERRTIPKFKPEVVPQKTILEAIELARWAPNHKLTEPWRFYFLGPETTSQIAHLNAKLVEQKRGPEAAQKKLARWLTMPGWLLVTSQLAEDALRRKEDYASCCCAIHNLTLALWSQGIGVKWTTGPVTRDPGFYELVDVDPAQEEVVGVLWYGYPAEVPVAPIRKKTIAEIVQERP